jgi:hypothetical protein
VRQTDLLIVSHSSALASAPPLHPLAVPLECSVYSLDCGDCASPLVRNLRGLCASVFKALLWTQTTGLLIQRRNVDAAFMSIDGILMLSVIIDQEY